MARKIERRIPAYVAVSYQCETCKHEYPTPTEAENCEAKPVEEKKFTVGNRVSWREARQCRENWYFLNGRITKVSGPTIPDEEYNLKWLGGRLSGMHVYEYTVAWTCPFCHAIKDGRFYGIELIKVPSNLPFRNVKKMNQFMRRNGMYSEPAQD